MIGVLTEGTWTCDMQTGNSLGLSKFQILTDFGQNLALCIAVFELMHEEIIPIVTGVISPNTSAGDACPGIVLGGQ